MAENYGKITQVIGPVVDIAFESEGAQRPPIYTALSVERPDGSENAVHASCPRAVPSRFPLVTRSRAAC